MWQTFNTGQEWFVRDAELQFTLCFCEDESEADAVVEHLGSFALEFEQTENGRRLTKASRAEAIDLLCEIAPYASMPTAQGWQLVRDLWFQFGTMGEPLVMTAKVE